MSYETRIETDSGVVSETSSLKSSSPSHLYTNEVNDEAVQILLPELGYGAMDSHDGLHIEDESQELQNTNSETHLLRPPSLNLIRRMSQDVMRRMSQCVIKTIPTTTWQILSKTWIWNLTMLLTYIICLSVFPSITALVESTYGNKVINIVRVTSNKAAALYLSIDYDAIKSYIFSFRVMFGMINILHLSDVFCSSTLVATLG